MLRRLIARLYWAFSRWTLVTEPAPTRPTVLLGVPHTSNWDFVLMLGIAWRLGMKFRWLGKKSLFAGWRGPIMRAIRGHPGRQVRRGRRRGRRRGAHPRR